MRVLVGGGERYRQLVRSLDRGSLELCFASSRREVLEQMGRPGIDCLCAPYEWLEAMDYRLVRRVRQVQPGVPVLALSASDLGSSSRFGEPDERDLWGGFDGHVVWEMGGRWLETQAARAGARRRSLVRPRGVAARFAVLLAGQSESFDHTAIREVLDGRRMDAVRARTAVGALEQLRQHRPVLAVMDEGLVESTPQSVFAAASRFAPQLYMMVLAKRERTKLTDRALSSGAREILWEPLGKQQLWSAIRGALDELELATPAFTAEPRCARVVVIAANDYLRCAASRQIEGRGVDVVRVDPAQVEDVPSAVHAARPDAVLIALGGDDSAPTATFLDATRGLDGVPLLALVQRPTPAVVRPLITAGAEDVIDSTTLGQQQLWGRLLTARFRFAERTKFRAAVADLQSREVSQRSVLSRSADGMVVVDQKGDVMYANPAAQRLLEGVSGSAPGEAFPWPPSNRDRISLPSGASDAEPRTAEMSSTPIVWEDQHAWLITLRDVTERVRADSLREKLLHSERLASIGQLAAGITHEINNPSAYVVANLLTMRRRLEELLAAKEPIPPESLEEFRAMLDEGVQGMGRIKRITRDLHTFARIESDEVERVDLSQVVETACNIAYSEIRYRARLVKELGDTPIIPGARGKLAQIATNLLINAAQAIEEGFAEQNLITISTGCDSKEVWIAVEDSGRGIPDEVREKIFEPFFTTKPRGVGTGLGLSLCADIARQHGGGISLYNRPQGGTRVEVRLPIAGPFAECALAEVPAVAEPELSGPLKILVIDDEPLVLRGYRRMLSDHEVEVAAGGKPGVEVLEQRQDFDLILCDLMMPDLDGVGVHRRVAERHPELLSRFAFCSGGALTSQARDYIERRGVCVLEKPLSPAGVAYAVDQLRRASEPSAGAAAPRSSGFHLRRVQQLQSG